MEENELNFNELKDLMPKIEEARKDLKYREKDIELNETFLKEETRIGYYEEGKAKIEKLKQQKEEIEEQVEIYEQKALKSVNALIAKEWKKFNEEKIKNAELMKLAEKKANQKREQAKKYHLMDKQEKLELAKKRYFKVRAGIEEKYEGNNEKREEMLKQAKSVYSKTVKEIETDSDTLNVKYNNTLKKISEDEKEVKALYKEKINSKDNGNIRNLEGWRKFLEGEIAQIPQLEEWEGMEETNQNETPDHEKKATIAQPQGQGKEAQIPQTEKEKQEEQVQVDEPQVQIAEQKVNPPKKTTIENPQSEKAGQQGTTIVQPQVQEKEAQKPQTEKEKQEEQTQAAKPQNQTAKQGENQQHETTTVESQAKKAEQQAKQQVPPTTVMPNTRVQQPQQQRQEGKAPQQKKEKEDFNFENFPIDSIRIGLNGINIKYNNEKNNYTIDFKKVKEWIKGFKDENINGMNEDPIVLQALNEMKKKTEEIDDPQIIDDFRDQVYIPACRTDEPEETHKKKLKNMIQYDRSGNIFKRARNFKINRLIKEYAKAAEEKGIGTTVKETWLQRLKNASQERLGAGKRANKELEESKSIDNKEQLAETPQETSINEKNKGRSDFIANLRELAAPMEEEASNPSSSTGEPESAKTSEEVIQGNRERVNKIMENNNKDFDNAMKIFRPSSEETESNEQKNSNTQEGEDR